VREDDFGYLINPFHVLPRRADQTTTKEFTNGLMKTGG
jgi:hypothetical protein